MNGWIHIYKQTQITILDSTNKQKKKFVIQATKGSAKSIYTFSVYVCLEIPECTHKHIV